MRTPFIILASAFALASCIGGEPVSRVENAPSKSAQEKTVLVMGDSLSAGYQLPPESSYPYQLEGLLRGSGYAYRVSNAGVSGDTSSALLARTDWLLSGPLPDLAIVCIGANDGLQGLPVEQMDKNIRDILAKLEAKNVPTVFVGMKIPRNLGPTYVSAFDATFSKIAADTGVPFHPFLLEGVARDPSLNLPDGIHPNEKGYAIIAKNLFDFLVREKIVTK